MKAFIVPDAHGHLDIVGGLLEHVGLVSALGERLDYETKIIQLGDLCNCVAGSIDDDLRCLLAAPDWFDVYLVGNHEHPYFGGPRFGGFWSDPQIRDLLRRYESRGLIRPCVAVDGVLVSHAGVASHGLAGVPKTAEAFEDWTLDAWRESPAGGLFSSIGRYRGGFDLHGGILWSDWSEARSMAFSQVVGHTVGSEVRWKRHGGRFAVCLDLGAGKHSTRIAGAWLRDGEIEVVTYESRPREDEAVQATLETGR